MNILCTAEYFSLDTFPSSLNVIKNTHGRILTEEEVTKLIEQYQPIGLCAGVEPLTRSVLEQAKDLKVISRLGAGLDSVDLKAAADLGINVYNTPDAPVAAVAEHVIGLTLGMIRYISLMDAKMRQRKWEQKQGVLLSEKTVGLIGCGRIGSYVAKLMLAFGCTVIAYDPFLKEHGLCELLPLEKVLEEADILSLHIPYTPENHHFIGKEQLKLMKSSAILINTARGKLVDESALIEALNSGEISGVALDVYETEPYEGPLMDLSAEKVLLTPHVASSARETRIQMEEETVENLLKGLKEAGIQF